MEQRIINLEQKMAQLEYQVDHIIAATTEKDLEMHRLHLQIQAQTLSIDSLRGMLQQGAGEDANPPPPHY